MKRIGCLLLILVMLALSACSKINQKPAALGESIDIPADGIISSSVFAEMKAQNKIVTFKGESGGIAYEWPIFGSEIKEPADLNLGIEITEVTKNKISFRFLSAEDFGFSPVLTFMLNTSWDTEGAALYAQGDLQTAICDVSITGGAKSVLKYPTATQTGSFCIRTAASTSDSSSGNTSPATKQEQSRPEISRAPSEEAPSATQSKPASVSVSSRPLSDGSSTKQDPYKTDPVPEGKPMPVEPDSQTVNQKKTHTCTFSIECSTILNHLKDLDADKLDVVPSNGIIFKKATVTFYEGESVYDVLQRVCKENSIHMEASWTPIYNSAYVEGIHNLYEFDCGSGSGWMYRVDGWYPNYGCSRYQLTQGETVEWRYTCDLGNDICGGYAIGGN